MFTQVNNKAHVNSVAVAKESDNCGMGPLLIELLVHRYHITNGTRTIAAVMGCHLCI